MAHVDLTVPYPWPYDGCIDPARTAVVVAGAQTGWAARSSRAAAVGVVVERVASALRAAGAWVVIIRHTAAPGRRLRSLPPRSGDDGWRLALAPAPSDLVVDAGGVDGFHGGPLDDILRGKGVDHLVLCGYGHEAAVDSTLRSANDRGYECLVLSDGVAPFDDDTGARALSSVTMSGGIFGAVGTSLALLAALHSSIAPPLEVVG